MILESKENNDGVLMTFSHYGMFQNRQIGLRTRKKKNKRLKNIKEQWKFKKHLPLQIYDASQKKSTVCVCSISII